MRLNEDFNQPAFTQWVESFLPDFSTNIQKVDIPNSFQGINSIQTIGESSLGVRVYIIETQHDPSKRKVGLTKGSFTLLRDYGTPNALIAYYSENSSHWRLSLLTSTFVWDEGRINKRLSNPKRQSYVLGTKAKTKTPQLYLINQGKIDDFLDLKSRFSLEVVNKEFYKEISHAFAVLVGGTIVNGKSKKIVNPLLRLPGTKDQSRTSLEFAVRLIGRIIFCWFLREKRGLSNRALIPKELLSSKAVIKYTDYYHKILEPIFFEILNKPIKTRKDQFTNEPYSSIPYLNGGLFSPREDDYYNSLQMKFPHSTHNLAIVPDSWIHSLFDVLETYNFTIDENTSFDEELSIDPEMLGRIFENLLAEINPETGESARKNTGSYYTPRVIVDYMVDESLILYLKDRTGISDEKLRALISYNIEDDSTKLLDVDEKNKIIQILTSIRILDPSCGSGAFPIGALQKIVYILQHIDPEGQRWFKKQIENTPIELRKIIEREFEEKNFDYIRKLGIIRENIYGIDLQPIATEISRLRCFLTLIVDQRIDESLENRGIEPLPNLDFKFVTANSLMRLPDIVENQEEGQLKLIENLEKINQLKEIRNLFFNAKNEERQDLKYKFANLQKHIFKELEKEYGWGGIAKAEFTRKITDWDPFTQNATDWFDPEWMFGVKNGFDIILANPPYIDSETMVKDPNNLRNTYKDLYTSTKGNWDLYIPFLELGYNLLSDCGIACYITPNKWYSINYGALIRKKLNPYLRKVGNCNSIKVFEAGNSPVVTLFGKKAIHTEVIIDELNKESQGQPSSTIDKKYIESNFGMLLAKNLNLVLKLMTNHLKVGNDFLAENPCSVAEAYELQPLIQNNKSYNSNLEFKFINTGTIDKYTSLWGIKETRYLKQNYTHPVIPIEQYRTKFPRRYIQMNRKKIILSGMRNFESYFDSEGLYIAGKSTEILVSKKNRDLRIVLAFLNSKVHAFYIKEVYGSLGIDGGINFTTSLINSLPMPQISINDEKELCDLVNEIISISENPNLDNQDQRASILNKIDLKVCNLFNLNEKEIDLIFNDD